MTHWLPGAFSSVKRDANSRNTPRLYPVSRSRYSKQLSDAYPLHSTNKSSVCSPASDIQVITRIQIQIEGENSMQSRVQTPISTISDMDAELKAISNEDLLGNSNKTIV